MSIKVSIITCVYNGVQSIENSIRSVFSQDYENIEYIIIDGGSTDGTINIIKKYEDRISFWLSEPDKGIGDAWNKGLKAATGELIGLLNADDMYHKTAVLEAVKAYKDYGDSALFYGKCSFISDGAIVRSNNKKFNAGNLIRGFGFVHTTCFVPKKVYERLGGFDINFKVAVDSEFLLRCYLAKVEFVQANIITYMSLGGLSDSKAKYGYFEYLDIIHTRNLYNKKVIRLQKLKYVLYYPFRGIIKSLFLRKILRQAKHSLVWFINLTYNLIPTFTLKNCLLRMFGIEIEQQSYIHPKTIIYRNGNISIGRNSVINPDSLLDNRNRITIGNNVSISHGVRIYTNGHDIDSPFADMIGKDVVIEDYVFIFANAQIMPGVTIGKGGVVYAGSVVTKNVEPFSVVGGNPAKFLKKRSDLLIYKNDYGFTGILA